VAHLTSEATRCGKLFQVRSDEQNEPRALVVTIVTCEGELVATWRTAFTPELQARDPAAVEQLLAQQHLEVMDLLDEGAFDHAARTPRSEIDVIAEPADPATRSLASGPTEEVLPLDAPAAPATPAGSIPHNHPAFAGIPMHDWPSDEIEPVGLDLAVEARPAARSASPSPPQEKWPVGPGGVASAEALPAPPAPEPVYRSAPPTPPASPGALHERGLTRAKRPSLPDLPVVRLTDDSPLELGAPAPNPEKPRR
jgi:hypothetical protein